MGKLKIFGHKPVWVQRFYNLFGSKLQKYANKIKAWNDPVLNKFLDDLCKASPKLAKACMAFVIQLYAKYGIEKARKIVDSMKGELE